MSTEKFLNAQGLKTVVDQIATNVNEKVSSMETVTIPEPDKVLRLNEEAKYPPIVIAQDENNRFMTDAEKLKLANLTSAGDGTGANVVLKQVTKLNVVASASAPKVVEIAIPTTTDFKTLPVEVLKLEPGQDNVVTTICNFDNGDATDFVFDERFVEFKDGVMKLKTEFPVTMSEPIPLGSGFYSESEEIDLSIYKTVESIS